MAINGFGGAWRKERLRDGGGGGVAGRAGRPPLPVGSFDFLDACGMSSSFLKNPVFPLQLLTHLQTVQNEMRKFPVPPPTPTPFF